MISRNTLKYCSLYMVQEITLAVYIRRINAIASAGLPVYDVLHSVTNRLLLLSHHSTYRIHLQWCTVTYLLALMHCTSRINDCLHVLSPGLEPPGCRSGPTSITDSVVILVLFVSRAAMINDRYTIFVIDPLPY